MTDQIEQHLLVSELKRISSELQRPPTMEEFISKSGISIYQIKKHYRNYSLLIQASGLKAYSERRKMPPTEELFRADLEEVLENKIPAKVIELAPFPRIAIAGDIHAPFHHEKSIEKFLDFVDWFKPEYVIQMGDAYDFLSHSKFPRSYNTYNPHQEEMLARKFLEEFWKGVKTKSPGAKCIQIVGNHDLRPLKRTLESVPTIEHWAEKIFKELMTFDGVETILDHRQEYELAGILFTHGFLGKEGAHRDFYLQNVVIGHLHKLWVQYRRFHGQSFFEMCCGFLGDPESKALSYTPSKKANYQLGFSAVDKFGPRLIHV